MRRNLLLLALHLSPLVRRRLPPLRQYPPQPRRLLPSVIVQVEVQEQT